MGFNTLSSDVGPCIQKYNFVSIIISGYSFIGSELKIIFHWNMRESLSKLMPESSMFLNKEKTEKSSSNKLLFETKFSDKSLI